MRKERQSGTTGRPPETDPENRTSNKERRVWVEICCCSFIDVRSAIEGGANGVEICSDLACGGVTPERDLVQRSSAIARPNVLIRPRGGDFVYSRAELDAMLAQIAGLADADVGLVIGALQPDRTIDESATRRLLQGSSPARFTFHKAFDLVPNPTESLEVLIDLGFRRVLTSGGPVRAIDGIATLARLVEAARGRIEVVAGGAIRIEHLPPLVKDARLDALHLGSGVRPASQSRAIEPVAANLVRDVVEALRQ